MTSSVTICSNAMVMLGAAPFSSFDEPRDQVRAAAVLYESVRDDVLRAHPWNCATKRVILAPLTATPPFDFNHTFQLPGDWLRTVQVGRAGCPIPFRTEGLNLLADVTALPLVYIFRNVQEDSWSSNLVHVMELAMAAKLAYMVTASSSLRDSQRDEYARELKIAKAVDGQDDPPEEFLSGSFVESRF